MASHSRPRARRGAPALTERDLVLLAFAAEHRLILAAHARCLFGVSESVAQRRLRALAAGGYMTARRVFAGRPVCYQIARDGLAVAGSDLPPPRLDVRAYTHDVGVAWLWLAARRGAFGPLREIVGERTLRSNDARSAAGRAYANDQLTQPYGVRLGGFGGAGRERLHYPDLLLRTADGRRIAVELELTSKGRARRERILAGYGSDARISSVLYLVDHPSVGRAIEASARRLGIDSLVHVQRVRQTLLPPGLVAGSAATRAASRTPRYAPSRGAAR